MIPLLIFNLFDICIHYFFSRSRKVLLSRPAPKVRVPRFVLFCLYYDAERSLNMKLYTWIHKVINFFHDQFKWSGLNKQLVIFIIPCLQISLFSAPGCDIPYDSLYTMIAELFDLCYFRYLKWNCQPCNFFLFKFLNFYNFN